MENHSNLTCSIRYGYKPRKMWTNEAITDFCIDPVAPAFWALATLRAYSFRSIS